MAYDPNNVFAKILRGEIPAKVIYQNEHVLAFPDIAPKRKIHVLLIPKGAYTDIADFGLRASDAEKAALMTAVSTLSEQLGITSSGFRLITNCKEHGHQEVPHLHFHLLGGEPVGAMVS